MKNKNKKSTIMEKYPFITKESMFIPYTSSGATYYIEISESSEIAFKLEYPEYKQEDMYRYALSIIKNEDSEGRVHLRITS